MEEISVFLESAWYGMCIAASYDILRVFRRVIKCGYVNVGIQDFLFWLAAGIAIFSMVFQFNEGTVRGYIFLALFFGAYIYHKSVSRPIVRFLTVFLNFIFTFFLKKPLSWSRIVLVRLLKIMWKPWKKFGAWFNNSNKGGKAEYGKKKCGKHHDQKKEKRKTRDIRD